MYVLLRKTGRNLSLNKMLICNLLIWMINIHCLWMKLSWHFFYQNSTKNLKLFYWKSKKGERYLCWADYLFSKIAVDLNNPGGEYLGDGGGHQAGLDSMGMSIGMSLKFAPYNIVHQIKIWARFGCFMASNRFFLYFQKN